jgi:hypothetical protein
VRRIVHLETLDFLVIFAAPTGHLDRLNAFLALALMALHSALMKSTRHKLVARVVAHRDWVCAALPLPTDQVDYLAPPAGTENGLFRHFLASSTVSFVTELLTEVIFAVQHFAADLPAAVS